MRQRVALHNAQRPFVGPRPSGAVGAIAIVLVAIAAFFTFACGGDDEERSTPAPTANPAEQEIADAVLLRLADFPTGWAETPDDEESGAFDKCNVDSAPGITARAETGEFSEGSLDSMSQSAAVFETADQANASIDRVPALAECMVAEAKSGALDDDDARVTDATFSRVSFPSFGDRTESYRVSIEIQQKGGDASADFHIDVIYVVEGRVITAVFGFGVFSPFSSSMLEEMVGVVADRMAAQVARAD
jgi:hypothetical protein